MRVARLFPALALLAACGGASDVERSAQATHDGRTLAQWWELRRAGDERTAEDARAAIRMLGPAAVPFLADKAASANMPNTVGGGAALEDLCPNAVPAMEAARARRASPALDAAIRRVRADSARRVAEGACAPDGTPARPEPRA
jgi:hypothetical protein